MMLRSIKFRELMNRDNEWSLDELALSQVNLLVGKNATGKTRTLNVINFLSTLLTGERQDVISTAGCETVFREGNNTWKYNLEFDNGIVVLEDLFFNDEHVLRRRAGGLGYILTTIEVESSGAERPVGGKELKLKFSVPGSRLAVVAKRDATQHPFLTSLFQWAESVRIFRFGNRMNPENLALAVKDIKIETNEKETSSLVPIFAKAKNEFGQPYVQAIIDDMKSLGYDLESIDIRRPRDLIVSVLLPGELHGIYVKEREIPGPVDQTAMSQGMYRALSLVGQVNYYALAKKGGCLLVDDIGEGLDFERSCAIVELLRDKAKRHGFQVIMSTNDRFVMNHVPLTEWSVLRRSGNRVVVHNHENSPEAFERFEFTGLSNFDFFATDFLDKEEREVVAP